ACRWSATSSTPTGAKSAFRPAPAAVQRSSSPSPPTTWSLPPPKEQSPSYEARAADRSPGSRRQAVGGSDPVRGAGPRRRLRVRGPVQGEGRVVGDHRQEGHAQRKGRRAGRRAVDVRHRGGVPAAQGQGSRDVTKGSKVRGIAPVPSAKRGGGDAPHPASPRAPRGGRGQLAGETLQLLGEEGIIFQRLPQRRADPLPHARGRRGADLAV